MSVMIAMAFLHSSDSDAVYDCEERVFVLSRVAELDTACTWHARRGGEGEAQHGRVEEEGWRRPRRGEEGLEHYVTCNTCSLKKKKYTLAGCLPFFFFLFSFTPVSVTIIVIIIVCLSFCSCLFVVLIICRLKRHGNVNRSSDK